LKNSKIQNEQKILELLYTGEPANDLLAFEMIKHLEKDKMLLIALFCIQWSIKNRELIESINNFLDKDICLKKFSYRERYLIKSFIIDKLSRNEYLNLRGHLSNQAILDILFLLIKRGRGRKRIRENDDLDLIKFFLIYDDGGHPKRKFVVDKLANFPLDGYRRSGSLPLYGLFYEELKECFRNKQLELRGGRRIKGKKTRLVQSAKGVRSLSRMMKIVSNLNIVDLKTDSFPINIQKFQFKRIRLRSLKDEFISVLPEYLFLFKNFESLDLSIDNLNIFKKAYKEKISVNELVLNCTRNVEITSFDFLDLFSNLKEVTINHGFISHPRILLGLGKVKVRSSFSLRFNSEYEMMFNRKMISFIALFLNEMPLSTQEREYFFTKILALRDLGNMSTFSDKEIERLAEFIPTNRPVRRIMDGPIRKELTLRNLGFEISGYLNEI